MAVYFFVIILPMLLSTILLNTKNRVESTIINSNIRRVKLSSIYYLIIWITYIIIIGFRDISVGIDTQSYLTSFSITSQLSLKDFFAIQFSTEKGYSVFEYIIGTLGFDFTGLLVASATIYITSVSFVIKKYSRNPWMSFFIFVAFGFFTFGMSAIRQSIAMGLILIAFNYAVEKKVYKYLMFVLLATTFHTTAIVFLPVYWVGKIQINKFTIFLLLCLMLLIIDNIDYIQLIFIENARITYEEVETGGLLMIAFIALSLVLCYFVREPFFSRPVNSYLFYVMIGALLLLIVTRFNPATTRLSYYCLILTMVYIPNMLSYFRNKYIRNIGYLAYIIVLSYFFFWTILVEEAKLYPYKLIF